MFISSLALMALASFPEASGSTLRYRANRVQSTTDFRAASSKWKALRQTQSGLIDELQQEQLLVETQIEDMAEMMEEVAALDGFSMGEIFTSTMAPSAPSGGSSGPTVSVSPSAEPSASRSPSTSAPSVSTKPSTTPSTIPSQPSSEPSLSTQPSLLFEAIITPTRTPTFPPSDTPTDKPSMAPTDVPTASPSSTPSVSVAPSSSPTTGSPAPTTTPTLVECQITEREREILIFWILDQVADSALIRDLSTPQGMAADFIIHQDARRLCPDNAKLIQRWVITTVYFSTGGDDWIKCSASGSDPCGTETPFVGKTAFLSPSHECQWAGISCNFQACVTEIEFEENNLNGTIPTEMGLLSELAVWGMERGGLSGTIPTEIGNLTNLIFLDLDYNTLTGSLPTELYTLVRLTQLDLNDNCLSGNITGVDSFPEMEFLQLHSNLFTGTVPFGVGAYTEMDTFTLHNNSITGVMPFSVCELLSTSTTNGGGYLTSLIADCDLPNPKIVCDCCTDCRGAPLGPLIITSP